VFTDAERLRITNAFSRQLNHRKHEGVYGRTTPPRAVGSRHGQWSAVSLYCLGRYFQKDYPHPIWQHCVDSARLHFRPLHQHSWVNGENDNLFWFNTGIAPIFTYLVLTGEREPLENGVLADLLRDQEMLISGRQPDWALNSASLGYLHKAAYLTGDGRYLHYRQRTGVDTSVFRLGQSFWPDEQPAIVAPSTNRGRPAGARPSQALSSAQGDSFAARRSMKAEPPEDLVGSWFINGLPKPMWSSRASGLPFDESFQFGSFRSAPDASGDFLLIDGLNGASRNPYHTFAALEQRLNGYTLLRGYRNQVLTRADGLVEPKIAMDAALKHRDVIGQTATATAEVPHAAYCNWRRTIAQRVNQYALFVDRLRFRGDAEHMEVQILWETERAAKVLPDGHLEFSATRELPTRETTDGAQIWPGRPMHTRRHGRVATMQWLGPVRSGQHLHFFSLMGIAPKTSSPPIGCFQLAENAAALALPSPALAVAGEYIDVKADLAIVAGDHLFGHQLEHLGGNVIMHADPAVDIDWDFRAGIMHVVAHHATQLRFSCDSSDEIRVDTKALAPQPGGSAVIQLSPGRFEIRGARLSGDRVEPLKKWLGDLLAEAREKRARAVADTSTETRRAAGQLEILWEARLPDSVSDLVQADQGTMYAASGQTIHRFSTAGEGRATLATDGAIRLLRWWPEHRLLLAGCVDEQVIAFGPNGDRAWIFTSEMDPAVFQAAKTYWFKSAPGHEGIHGLHTGTFLEGRSQAFVGSACTLEILDEHGKLIHRMPQFWGKVSHFTIIDGPGNSLNLLASRKYNGTNRVAIINNQTLNPSVRGFDGVPQEVTYVGGWSSMNRHHLFYVDLDGDGVKEVMSEINGSWNRITVWRADGRPLYDASFGPGDRIPAKNMRDVDVGDLDGDGTLEIVTATSLGLVVALDHQCRKVWATQLNNAATVLKCVPRNDGPSSIVVGCEDGEVLLLNSLGKVTHRGEMLGSPTQALLFDGTRVVLASNKGHLKAFHVPR
jgi:hypothetical protein